MERALVFVPRSGVNDAVVIECEEGSYLNDSLLTRGPMASEIGIDATGLQRAGLYLWEGALETDDKDYCQFVGEFRLASLDDVEVYFEYRGHRDGLIMVGPKI